MIHNLLNGLHPAINKDGQLMPAISISGSGTAEIRGCTLHLTGATSVQFNLRTYTLSSLVTAINDQGGFTATLLQTGTLAAVVLAEGTYTSPGSLPMFTSFLWQLLKPVALALLDALGAKNQAILESVMSTSDGAWLDAFGELFDVYRQEGEPDELYAVRVFDFSIGHRANNLAIEKMLGDLGYNSTVTDNGAFSFDVNVSLPPFAPKGFVYSYGQLGDLVNFLKLAGTTATIILSGTLSDGVALSDIISATLKSSSWTWSSFTWGEFNW